MHKLFFRFLAISFLLLLSTGCEDEAGPPRDVPPNASVPYLVVLGTAQDGGIPQAGSHEHTAWNDPNKKRLVVSLGLVDPESGDRWMFEATPDFRQQWFDLQQLAPRSDDPGRRPVPDGIFLTHAHIGHYTGLMFLGRESIGASAIPVYSLPGMTRFLTENGPWSQLVALNNISLRSMSPDSAVTLNPRLSVTALPVPHRQEFSDVAGFRINGPSKSAFFLPDIDRWEDWDTLGVRIEKILHSVDYAFLDATFFDEGEIPGRDMSSFPHPKIVQSMNRFSLLPEEVRARIYFIHLNHTNPAADPSSKESRLIESAGFSVARQGQIFAL